MQIYQKGIVLSFIILVIISVSAYPQTKYSKTDPNYIREYHLKLREFSDNELDSVIYYNKLLLDKYLEYNNIDKAASRINEIAKLFQKKFEYDSAIAYINTGLAMLPNKNYENIIGELYFTLGTIHIGWGDYVNAEVYCKYALNTRLKRAVDKRLVSDCYSFLGLTELNMGHLDDAIYYYKKALEIKLPKKVHDRVISNNYVYISEAFLKKNDITQAKSFLLKGFSIYPIPGIYLKLGKVFTLENNFEAADTSLKKALALRLSQYGPKHEFTSECYNALGDLYKAKKDFARALEYYKEGLTSNLKSDKLKILSNLNISLKEILSVKYYFVSLLGYTSTLIELSKIDSAQSRLSFTRKLLAQSFTLLSELQKYYLMDGSKLILGEYADQLMNLGVEACYELYKLTGSGGYISQALLFSEKKRSSVLNESKLKREAMLLLGIPDSLKEAELKLKLRLNSFFVSAVETDSNNVFNKASDHQSKVIYTIQSYDSLMNVIQKKYPRYAIVLNADSIVTKKKLQEKTSRYEVLAEYTITRNNIFIFCITPDTFLLLKKPLKQDFEKLVKDFRNGIKKIDKKTYLSSARTLYNYLISPIDKILTRKKKFTVIPSSEIASIPFEALISSKGESLIEKFSIQYSSSSSSYLKRGAESETKYPFYFTGFAPPYENMQYYAPLDNKAEVNTISGFLKSKNLKSVLFTGKNATEHNLLNLSTKSEILHIAAHSFADTVNEGKSGIIFGDDILTAAEIIASDINNDLVVLSSCEGGSGKISSGEGVLSLARNFMKAGVKNVLAALWKVPDKHTKTFMTEFYRQVLKDGSYTEALARTKRTLIKDKLFAFPNTWSAFVLMN